MDFFNESKMIRELSQEEIALIGGGAQTKETIQAWVRQHGYPRFDELGEDGFTWL